MKAAENTSPREQGAREQVGHRCTTATTSSAALAPTLPELIAQQEFFKGLNSRQFEQLAESAMLMKFNTGEQIFSEGDPANRFFIILEGRVAVESEGKENRMIPVQTLGPGDDLGWSWLFPPHYLHFSARALEPVKLLFFYGTRLRHQCESDPALGYELMKRVGQVLVRRLEAMRHKLAESDGVRNS